MNDLYEADILAWSEQQAALLRRLAAGERVNDGVIDWPDIIEEIESVGREQLHAMESLLVQAMPHDRKAAAWPNCRDVPHWRAESRRCRDDAASRFAASMRQRIDVPRLYRRALRALPETLDGQPPLPMPEACPVTLDERMAESSRRVGSLSADDLLEPLLEPIMRTESCHSSRIFRPAIRIFFVWSARNSLAASRRSDG